MNINLTKKARKVDPKVDKFGELERDSDACWPYWIMTTSLGVVAGIITFLVSYGSYGIINTIFFGFLACALVVMLITLIVIIGLVLDFDLSEKFSSSYYSLRLKSAERSKAKMFAKADIVELDEAVFMPELPTTGSVFDEWLSQLRKKGLDPQQYRFDTNPELADLARKLARLQKDYINPLISCDNQKEIADTIVKLMNRAIQPFADELEGKKQADEQLAPVNKAIEESKKAAAQKQEEDRLEQRIREEEVEKEKFNYELHQNLRTMV